MNEEEKAILMDLLNGDEEAAREKIENLMPWKRQALGVAGHKLQEFCFAGM